MEPLQLLLFIILCLGIVLSIYFIWWVRKLPKPTPGNSCTGTGWEWNDSCSSFKEISYDSTLSSPEGLTPYLIGFSYSSGTGSPLYLPMWYRFRYVNVLTGGYSKFSNWSLSPVISGSCCLPCPDGVGVCSSQVPQGPKTCSYNKPIIGISQSDSNYNPFVPQSDGSFIYINVHRYVGKSYNDLTPPSATAQDEIIGYMTTGFNYEGNSYYGMVDVLNNPCSTSTTTGIKCVTPSWCVNPSNSICDGTECSS